MSFSFCMFFLGVCLFMCEHRYKRWTRRRQKMKNRKRRKRRDSVTCFQREKQRAKKQIFWEKTESKKQSALQRWGWAVIDWVMFDWATAGMPTAGWALLGAMAFFMYAIPDGSFLLRPIRYRWSKHSPWPFYIKLMSLLNKAPYTIQNLWEGHLFFSFIHEKEDGLTLWIRVYYHNLTKKHLVIFLS